MPSSTTSGAPSVRSRISCAILVSARLISAGSQTVLLARNAGSVAGGPAGAGVGGAGGAWIGRAGVVATGTKRMRHEDPLSRLTGRVLKDVCPHHRSSRAQLDSYGGAGAAPAIPACGRQSG